MKLPFGIVFHTLSRPFIQGWSAKALTTFDVARVMTIRVRPRLWCLFNQEYPICLAVKYHLPENDWNLGITSHGHVAFVHGATSEHTVTNRFKTVEDAEYEKNEIFRLQGRLQEWQTEQEKKIR